MDWFPNYMLDSTVPFMMLMLIWKTLFPQFIDDDHELMKVPCMDEGLEEFCTICKKLLLDGCLSQAVAVVLRFIISAYRNGSTMLSVVVP